MSRVGRRALAIGLLAGAMIAGGCSTASVRQVGPRIVDLDRDAGAGIAPVSRDRGQVVPAGSLRLLLEELLGVHGALTVEMMRQAAAGDASLQAWIDALAANTAELSGAIGLVYGPDGARAFDQLWSFHTQFFLSYADAVRRGDTGAARTARHDLSDYQTDFASFVGAATGGRAPKEAVAEMLGVHIDQMLGQLDAYRVGDLGTALGREHDGHEYLVTIGTTLAGAIAAQDPVAFPGPVDDADIAFCSIVAAQATSLADSIVATTTIGGREGELTASERAALADYRDESLRAIGATLDADVSQITDVFRDDQVEPLASVLLAQVTDPTPELMAVANDLATLGPRLLADAGNASTAPAAIRDFYAIAYRLSSASTRH